VRVRAVAVVPGGFDARFLRAVARYVYVIADGS